MQKTILRLIDNAAKTGARRRGRCEGDYIGPDGLLICGKCHMAKQTRFCFGQTDNEIKNYFNGKVVPRLCECQEKERAREEAEQKKRDVALLTEHFRQQGITDPNYLSYTFANDDRKKPKISDACQKYAKNFPQMRRENRGLLFFGNVGTGKTFYAVSIANAVLEQGRSVLVTNMPSLIGRLGVGNEEKQHTLNQISQVSLLVIDDLGTERETQYALEKVYEIVDTRYRSGQPLIVTTNLPLYEIKKCKNISYGRVYSRVLQMCYPIAVLGADRRETAEKTRNEYMGTFLGL